MPDRRIDASSSHSNDSSDCTLLNPRLLRFKVCSSDDGVALGVLAASSSSSGTCEVRRQSMTHTAYIARNLQRDIHPHQTRKAPRTRWALSRRERQSS